LLVSSLAFKELTTPQIDMKHDDTIAIVLAVAFTFSSPAAARAA